jgi:putative ABC transport system ATP-binding protein
MTMNEDRSAGSRIPPEPLDASPAVRALGVTKRYGKGDAAVTALDNVSVALPAGRFTAVLGASGSGKSTLMHCLAGLDTVSAGAVFLGDVELTALSERGLTRLRRTRVGFVFQAFNLLPTLTVEENLLLPLRIAGQEADRAWHDGLVEMTGLRSRLRHRPGELSGGQQQRLAIARALISKPVVVFADEPTGNLDSHAGARVLELLRRCVDEFGQTIVMVTHDPVAAGHADWALFVSDGTIVDEMAAPTPARVLDRILALGEAS